MVMQIIGYLFYNILYHRRGKDILVGSGLVFFTTIDIELYEIKTAQTK